MAPRTREQFQKMREKSQGKILKSALELFSQKGFHQTSIDAIAKYAEISKGLIYNYFDSKEEILLDIVTDGFKLIKELENFVPTSLTPKQKFDTLLTVTFNSIKENSEFWKMFFHLLSQPDVITKLSSEVDKMYSSLFKMLELHLSELGVEDVENQAKLLGAMIDGVAIHYYLNQEHYPIDLMKDKVIQLYCGEEK
ncbi:MAG: TetR/AcrR family transcriptional regulator [Candidatus Marinimicrobia bacterium]|nr:TetR/AcrR family transcriptional regulator [Candidatus Neomarinimicrobiota bacterium]MBL7023741.1 TetR/AcrR family transcriptional regulator [Candidatus Neomarinimicrobiota bacterium]MBL7109589.1 TetR/AcrR family transcriptional regulator [Candidatus Neomarinimicrobiota bacterium]